MGDLQNFAAPKLLHAGASFARIRKAKRGDFAARRFAEMMNVETQRQRFEHIQRRHARFRKTVADLVGHLPAQFAENVADPSGVLRFDAIKKNGEMVGKNRAVRAAPTRVMRHGNQISAVLVATLDGDGMQGAEGRREIKVAAPETAIELLTARVNARRLLGGEIEDAIIVPARSGTRPGRQ